MTDLNGTLVKMNPEIKKRWVAALRSGKYQQGKASLHTFSHGVDRFCCLGVLCEILVEDGATARSGVVRYQDRPTGRKQDVDSEYYPPRSVQELAGIAESPQVVIEGRLEPLSGLNDNGAYTFAQIADLIEEQL
jgi:hypothetical protein